MSTPRAVPVTAAAFALALASAGCGVSKTQYDAKVQEAEAAKQQVADLQAQLAALQGKVSAGDQQVNDLKNALGLAQSQAMTDDQKAALEEARRAMQDAQERAKQLDDLNAKFKKLIDAGQLKVTTRHGRIVLLLKTDVLFDKGEAEVKPEGKAALTEVAGTLRSVQGKRFQVAGHTDSAPVTAATKAKFPTNWELSAARAIAVVKLLTGAGVDPGSISAAGYGPYDPFVPNSSADNMAKNRRIEITLVPNVADLVPPSASPPPAPSGPPAASAH